MASSVPLTDLQKRLVAEISEHQRKITELEQQLRLCSAVQPAETPLAMVGPVQEEYVWSDLTVAPLSVTPAETSQLQTAEAHLPVHMD